MRIHCINNNMYVCLCTFFCFSDFNLYRSENLFVYCCDFSKSAVELVQQHPEYDRKRCSAFVADITDLDAPYPFGESSVDIITMIFVLSALKPEMCVCMYV